MFLQLIRRFIMTYPSRLTANHLSYSIPNSPIQFDDLNLSFEKKSYGLIGDNGVGKTTLLKLLTGELAPHSGNIILSGSLAYCPQTIESQTETLFTSEILGIHEKWQALNRLQRGTMLENDLDIIGDDWTLESEVKRLFERLDLPLCSLNMQFMNLSGGQKTKVLLAKAMLTKADFILLDEPTNNLDSVSKQILLKWIRETQSGFIIVSHDRTLLNSLDEIIEITSKGINRFGGNYDFYEIQKAMQQASLQGRVSNAEKELKQITRQQQTAKERHEQRQKQGQNDHRSGRQPDKILADFMMDRSGQTLGRQTRIKHQRIQQAHETLQSTKSQLEIKESIHADLSATALPTQRQVLQMKDITFAYPYEAPLFEHFNLSITGPERIAIVGKNGCGKSTLIKLICGQIKPQQGNVEYGVSLIRVLDQQCDFLTPSLNLIENFQKLNPEATIQDAYSALASMQFRNVQAEKMVRDLSGGERIRAGLAISLLSKTPPQLIILDEPTNHLDLRSIKAIEEILTRYQGAMIVISHDENFINNIQIVRKVPLL